jgi:hypothetical protein
LLGFLTDPAQEITSPVVSSQANPIEASENKINDYQKIRKVLGMVPYREHLRASLREIPSTVALTLFVDCVLVMVDNNGAVFAIKKDDKISHLV